MVGAASSARNARAPDDRPLRGGLTTTTSGFAASWPRMSPTSPAIAVSGRPARSAAELSDRVAIDLDGDDRRAGAREVQADAAEPGEQIDRLHAGLRLGEL